MRGKRPTGLILLRPSAVGNVRHFRKSPNSKVAALARLRPFCCGYAGLPPGPICRDRIQSATNSRVYITVWPNFIATGPRFCARHRCIVLVLLPMKSATSPLRKESDVHSYSLSEFRLLNLSRCVRACLDRFGLLKLTIPSAAAASRVLVYKIVTSVNERGPRRALVDHAAFAGAGGSSSLARRYTLKAFSARAASTVASYPSLESTPSCISQDRVRQHSVMVFRANSL